MDKIAQTNEKIRVALDIECITNIQKLVNNYSPKSPYPANVIKRIRIELHNRDSKL